MRVLRDLRAEHGLSQRALAARAGLSFRGVQLLESPGHDARVSSLAAVAGALGLPDGAVERALAAALGEPADSMRSASLRVLRDGDASWKTHLFDCVDAMRRSGDTALVASAPVAELPPRLRALFAATAEALCAESSIEAPPWAADTGPLDTPWFVAGFESLRASALVESPLAFRRRNVFVLASFLERA